METLSYIYQLLVQLYKLRFLKENICLYIHYISPQDFKYLKLQYINNKMQLKR